MVGDIFTDMHPPSLIRLHSQVLQRHTLLADISILQAARHPPYSEVDREKTLQ